MNPIDHRVSIRKYQERPVENEKILQILKAGMQAPSACNQQPWEFYVVTDKETLIANHSLCWMCCRCPGSNHSCIQNRIPSGSFDDTD